MADTGQIKELLDQKMTRQNFLRAFGVGLLAVFGAGNVLSYLLRSSNQSKRTSVLAQKTTTGFGASKFGR